MTAAIAAQQAITQQAVALEVVKQQAQVDRSIAALIDQASQSVPVSGRGGSVNISA